jgi:hypothetical protein
MILSFQWSLLQHHQRIDFTFHTTFVILVFAPSTVFFLQSSVNDANPTHKSYISPDEIIYTSLYVVIWLPVSKYSYTFFRRFVLSSIITKIASDYIWVTQWVSDKKEELLTLRQYMSSSTPVFGGVSVAHLLSFSVVLLCVFTFVLRCL